MNYPLFHEPPAQLAVIVPCYNEADNVSSLFEALQQALKDRSWEVVFVDDDSPDGTSARVAALAQRDSRVRLLRRMGRRGLSSAVIEGVLATSAPYIAVMDGDLQHDERILPTMMARLDHGVDLVVASRHVEGGNSSGLGSRWRHVLSDTGIKAARYLMPHTLNDPMSGFFVIRREMFEDLLPKLSGSGFKILLDLVMSASPGTVIEEVPFVFRPRLAGESKLDMQVLVQFVAMLVDKLTKGRLPIRFLVFSSVGLIGIFINLFLLKVSEKIGLGAFYSQYIGIFAAIWANFYLNNRVTYYEKRLRRNKFWKGFLLFLIVCFVGTIANIGVNQFLLHDFGRGQWNWSAIAGAMVGVVWNYAVSSALIWR